RDAGPHRRACASAGHAGHAGGGPGLDPGGDRPQRAAAPARRGAARRDHAGERGVGHRPPAAHKSRERAVPLRRPGGGRVREPQRPRGRHTALTEPSLAIQTEGLTKHFGDLAAVDGIDLAVPVGSVFGFLGPNGSGKTTTIRVLLGLINASEGSWQVLGRPMPDRARDVLPDVGALIEGPAFYPWLTGRQNLVRFDAAGPDAQRSTRKQRIDDDLARVGLTAVAGKKVKAYSFCMRQRPGLANDL